MEWKMGVEEKSVILSAAKNLILFPGF